MRIPETEDEVEPPPSTRVELLDAPSPDLSSLELSWPNHDSHEKETLNIPKITTPQSKNYKTMPEKSFLVPARGCPRSPELPAVHCSTRTILVDC